MRKFLAIAVLWCSCGYVASAQWAGHFYGEFGADGIETRQSAARSSLPFFIGGPLTMFIAFCLNEYPPMWDWPKHLFDGYKQPTVRP
jgi:hypothetical protein